MVHNRDLASMIRRVFREHQAPQKNTVYDDPNTDRLAQSFAQENAILWTALCGNQAVGCCGLFPTAGLPKGTAELVKFYLAAEYRGQGVGKELLQRTLNSARSIGYQSLYIESTPAFKKAVQIYLKLGFEPLDHPLGNSGHHGCSLYYLLHL